ncbi:MULTISPECIES: PH domain-containing protein [Paenibacillus]|uniref:PH domain-containing protein n=1 Tax=Paenibacillus TaxID=44249 RepID=UPI002041CCD5|nr:MULTISPECIES: PH domain-containing protein [Paenibacillus]
MMGMQVVLGDRELIVNISGLEVAAILKKEIKIPYTTIVDVQPGSFEFPWTAVKRAGITTMSYKAGSFVIHGEKYFLSYHDAHKVVILSLEGAEFDKIVLESEAPEQLANDIRARCFSL